MEDKVIRFLALYASIHRDHENHLQSKYEKMYNEMKDLGYSIEHGYGYYLHCPDGKNITLDHWNEEKP